MASISNIKRLADEAREKAADPANSIPVLRDAIWQLCDVVHQQNAEIRRLSELVKTKADSADH